MDDPARAKAQVHFETALMHREKGKLEEAVRHFREALRLHPATPAHGHLGILLADLGRYDEAILEFKAAVAANPADAGAYFRLGMLLAGRKRPAEAIEAYEGFIRRCPPNLSDHVEFARQRIAELKGPPRKAAPPPRPAPAKAAASAGDAASQARAKAQVHFETALVHREKGKLEEAARHFREALRLHPATPAHGHLGILLADLGRYDEAIAEFEAAVAANPADAGACFRLGMLLAGRSRHGEAAAAYEGFIAHCPPEMRGHVAFAERRVGELRKLVEKPAPRLEPIEEPAPPAAPPAQAAAPALAAPPAAARAAPAAVPRPVVGWALAGGAAIIALAWGGRAAGLVAWERYQRWRWPVPEQSAELAAPMLRDNAARRLAEAVHVYRRVAEALAAAESKGQDVAALRKRLKEAETLMRVGEPGYAMALLNVVELRIPRPAEKVRVAEQEDTSVESILKERASRRARAEKGKRGKKVR